MRVCVVPGDLPKWPASSLPRERLARSSMNVRLFADKTTLGRAAAAQAAEVIRREIAANGAVRILTATGGSQFEFLEVLTQVRDVAWDRVEMFHLDEYVGISAAHPASFCRY